ncbi:hypothetical protein BDR05DRAFT_653925 [Suillus weaverae]|nr:hypothetical protein BDR05DRAFT_653925 [Suillus weaverae]
MTIRAYYVHYTPLIWSCDMAVLRQILICMVAVSFKTCLGLYMSIFLLAQVSCNKYNINHRKDATFLTRTGCK